MYEILGNFAHWFMYGPEYMQGIDFAIPLLPLAIGGSAVLGAFGNWLTGRKAEKRSDADRAAMEQAYQQYRGDVSLANMERRGGAGATALPRRTPAWGHPLDRRAS